MFYYFQTPKTHVKCHSLLCEFCVHCTTPRTAFTTPKTAPFKKYVSLLYIVNSATINESLDFQLFIYNPVTRY